MAPSEKRAKLQRSAFELYLADDLQTEQVPVLSQELKPQDLCPQCRIGRLDYDGLLNLACDQCGFTVAGCFT
ncbi:MAG: hypothetical protein JW862_15420 [Anaerolineales bacterium]|nr:hypothetical protein [Anaerolineales bacterium]